jgi:hypothetical protein
MTHAITRAMLLDKRRGLDSHELRVRRSRRLRTLFFLVLAVLLGRTSVAEAAISTWNPNPEPDIAGYILSYGREPGVHPTSIDVGNVTTWEVATLTPGQIYYFVVQAYNTSGMISLPSAEVAFTAPVASPPTLTQPANQTSAENAAVSLQLLASNPGGGPLTYSATGLPPSLTVNAGTGVISGTPPFGSAGIYRVTAAVSDSLLTSSKTFTWTVTAVTQAPIITGLSQTSGPVGTPVTIAGANFGTRQGTSTVTFNGTAATPTTWAATSIVVPVPVGATTGVVVVTVGGVASNGVGFKVASKPSTPQNLRIAGGQ